MRGCDHFHCVFPARAYKAALSPLGLVRARADGIVDDCLPGQHGVAGALPLGPVHLEQAAADVRVLHAERRVDVPGERSTARTASRLVIGHVRAGRGVVDRLRLPGDQPVLDVYVPRAGPRAVDPVRGPDDFVVLPPVAVQGLPVTVPGHELTPTLGGNRPSSEEPMSAEQRVRRARSMLARFSAVSGVLNLLGISHFSHPSCPRRRAVMADRPPIVGTYPHMGISIVDAKYLARVICRPWRSRSSRSWRTLPDTGVYTPCGRASSRSVSSSTWWTSASRASPASSPSSRTPASSASVQREGGGSIHCDRSRSGSWTRGRSRIARSGRSGWTGSARSWTGGKELAGRPAGSATRAQARMEENVNDDPIDQTLPYFRRACRGGHRLLRLAL